MSRLFEFTSFPTPGAAFRGFICSFAGVPEDIEGKYLGVHFSPEEVLGADGFAEQKEEGEKEDKRQAIKALTPAESCNACTQCQLVGVHASLLSSETQTDLSSNLQADKHVPFANGVSTTVASQDKTRELQTFSCTGKETEKSVDPAAVQGISKSVDHPDKIPAIASISETMEAGGVKSELGQRKHKTTKSLDKSAFYYQRIVLQNKLLYESSQSLDDMREKIRRYRSGQGLSEVGGLGRASFAVPEMTTLLLVGPSGAGKSTLINNLIRILDNKTSGFDRAQPYEEAGDGSLFLQEYLVCKDSRHFSVFDSRGFSENAITEDLFLVRKWMTDGVCHGEAVCRPSDNKATKEALQGRGRQGHSCLSVRRKVHFVIFVVDAGAVYRMKKCHDQLSLKNLVLLYKSPYLSFKDDRPVVVMTHGDSLSPKERILTRIYIGKVFGISPLDQVFDISCFTGRTANPGDEDHINDLVLLNMLDFALERADRNLPYKNSFVSLLRKAHGTIINRWSELDLVTRMALLILLFCVALAFDSYM